MIMLFKDAKAIVNSPDYFDIVARVLQGDT